MNFPTILGALFLIFFLAIALKPYLFDYSASEVAEQSPSSNEQSSSGTFSSGSGIALRDATTTGNFITWCRQYNCGDDYYFSSYCYPENEPKYEAQCVSTTDIESLEFQSSKNPLTPLYLELKNFYLTLRSGL